MKKMYIVIASGLFLCAMAEGCKKDSNDAGDGGMVAVPKIDSTFYYLHGTVLNSTANQFDPQGRLLRVSHKDGSSDSLLYSSSQVVWKSFSSDGYLNEKDTYTLNAKGLATVINFDSKKDGKPFVDKTTKRMGFAKQTTGQDEVICEYNADGYLVKETYYNYYSYGDTVTYLYTINNGNVTGMTGTSTDPLYSFVVSNTFSYYTDKQNTIGDQNRGIAFLGKQSKNLPKTIIYTWDDYYLPDTVQYWYKFDNKKRVIVKYTSSTYSTYTDSTRYTYKN